MRVYFNYKPSFQIFLLCIFCLSCSREDYSQLKDVSVIPAPHELHLSKEYISLPIEFDYSDSSGKLERLGDFIQKETNQLFTSSNQTNAKESIPLTFNIDSKLGKEAYRMTINEKGVNLEASENFGFVRAATTLLQLPNNNGHLPYGHIEDEPDYSYRALMIDPARSWHSMSTLKQIIDLCFWYKIKYLHLHLTDDGLFTFPSTAFPNLASKQSFTLEELKELNEYAYQRGCILIPEIEMPGHSSNFVSSYPEIFALQNKDQNYWTINMGKEEVYDALEIILKEVAYAFPYSPYIHIGCDEVDVSGMSDDPDTKSYMEEHDVHDLDDLYHHFLVRVSDMVKRLDKKCLIWSDFTNKGRVKIPNDIVVMVWKTGAYHPDDLMTDGFKIINASWEPLYIVNSRKWPAKEIYNWNVNIWKAGLMNVDNSGISANITDNLIGASMEIWEQNEYKAITSSRQRLAAMSERLWNNSNNNYDGFEKRLDENGKRLNQFLYGFDLEESGLSYPDWKDSNYSESMWFDDSLTISANPYNEAYKVGYHYFEPENIKRELPNLDEFNTMDSKLVIKKGGSMAFQGYIVDAKKNRVAIGHPILKNYSLHPVEIKTVGLAEDYLPHNWDHHKYHDSLSITMSSKINGDIYYTLDRSYPTITSKKYGGTFILNDNAYIRAQLFSKESGKPIGKEFYQEYVKLIKEESLTTGKPVTTSNGDRESSVPSFLNDGYIVRWDHWGDHTDGESWATVDLGKEELISKFKTYTFWDGYRYYEYTIEISKDNENWDLVVDRSKNQEISTMEGLTDWIKPTKARYLRLNMIRNSANPGLHLVEFNAFRN